MILLEAAIAVSEYYDPNRRGYRPVDPSPPSYGQSQENSVFSLRQEVKRAEGVQHQHPKGVPWTTVMVSVAVYPRVHGM